MNQTERALPSLRLSVIAVLGVVFILMIGVILLNLDLHMLLIIATVWTAFFAKKAGFSWKDIEGSLATGVSKAMSALFIVVLIGMTIGAWIQAGTVPALIYYGLGSLTPATFLPAGFLICSITATATGSSWGTVGTIGLAMMGIGGSLGIPAPITAGMVISGAYFGDMISPLSDMTVLSTASAESDIFTHIRMMLSTSGIAYVLSLILYAIIGVSYKGGALDLEGIALIRSTLGETFTINIWVLLPVIITLGLSVAKVPAIPAMLSGVVAGGIVSVVFQGATLPNVLLSLNYGFSSSSGVDVIDGLLNAGGTQSMMWSFSMAFIALAMGGLLSATGFLNVIIEKLTRRVRKPASLCSIAYLSGLVGNLAMGEAYTTIILTGSLYKDKFAKMGLAKGMLSRCIQQSATIMSGLIPWATGGAFMFSVLGVNPFVYAPYSFVNWITPLVSILLLYRGVFMYTVEDEAHFEKKQLKKAKNTASL